MGQAESVKCQSCIGEDEKAQTLTLDPWTSGLDGLIHLPADKASSHAFTEVTTIAKETEQIKYISADGSEREIKRFKVSISKRPGETFGLAHMPMEDGSHSLLVIDLRNEGPIARWNKEQHALGHSEFQMRRGDRIVRVGNSCDIDAMRDRLRQDSVDFIVERWPEVIPVVMRKTDAMDRYGMQTDLIVREDDEKVLRVGRISGGLLGAWNKSAAADRRYSEIIAQHSEIIQVNDCEDDPARMQQLLVTESEVKILFKRPDPELYNR